MIGSQQMQVRALEFLRWGLSIAITVLIGIIGYYYTKKYARRYGDVYNIEKKGHGREKFVLTEKGKTEEESGITEFSRIILEKSSFQNHMGFMDVSLEAYPNEIRFERYAFANSCIHNVISPGLVLWKDRAQYVETLGSNEYKHRTVCEELESTPQEIDLEEIPKPVMNDADEIKVVKCEFDYPKSYTGPRRNYRVTVFAKGIGIIYSMVEYKDREVDKYVLEDYQTEKNTWFPIETIGNYWEFHIEYSHGPNKYNIQMKR